VQHLCSEWLDAEGDDLPLRLTLVLLLLAPVGGWQVRPLVLLLAVVGLLHRPVLRAPATWLLLSVLMAWRVIADWPMADNHAYLLCYWCLAVFLSRLTPAPGAALATSGRLLIGLAFAFATLWKVVLSPDFLDGTFFRVWLLADDRFEDVTLLIGNLDVLQLEASRDFLHPPQNVAEEHLPSLAEPLALQRAALVLTWATVVLEALPAVLFLLPVPARWVSARHLALLAFCIGTYAVVPVTGFGWLLLIMGLAACPLHARGLRATYAGCFALLVLYREIPWAHLINGG
jgi:hypothetical protein